MLKRLADWFAKKQAPKPDDVFMISRAGLEAIKLEFLNKGVERGRASMRTGTCFDLYLQRADPSDADDGYQRAAALGTGMQMPAPGVPVWAWWAVVNETGLEVCLGGLDKLTYTQALARYLELLPVNVRAEIGDVTAVAELDKLQHKETGQNG